MLDVDGVVVQSAPFTSNLEREYGIAAASLEGFFSTRFGECLIGVSDLKDELHILAPAIGWRGTVEELMGFWFESENSPDEALMGEVAMLRRWAFQFFLRRIRSDTACGTCGR